MPTYLDGKDVAALLQDTKAFAGTWLTGGVTVSFGKNPSDVEDTVYLTLQDGNQRSLDVSTPVTWAVANGIADLGYDEAGSQGNSKWLYFYAVPSSSDSSKLTIRASDNAPSTGPAGYTNYKLVCTAYMESGATLRQFLQMGNRFFYSGLKSAYSASSQAAFAWTSLDISALVPATANMVQVQLKCGCPNTNSYQYWVSGVNSSSYAHVQAWPATVAGLDISEVQVPIFTAQTVYHYLNLASGSGNSDYVEMVVLGYVDGSVEP